METILERIHRLAEPYLDTRQNDIHTVVSLRLAYEIMRGEGGDENIVLAAVILHDVGWKRVPENLQPQAYGPKAKNFELRRVHETEGASIAAEILKEVSFGEAEIREITEIIEGHDSRETALSLNDKIVKDADKLWRYTREGFQVDVERFEQTCEQEVERLRSRLEGWFFTETAKEIARRELTERIREAGR